MMRAIWILWPSFATAVVAEAVFFTLFDPMTLEMLGEPLALSRTAVYTVGFFSFWVFAALSSAFTCFIQRGADDVNRCPLGALERPAGCPRRVRSPETCR
jgi:hypothetical protein